MKFSEQSSKRLRISGKEGKKQRILRICNDLIEKEYQVDEVIIKVILNEGFAFCLTEDRKQLLELNLFLTLKTVMQFNFKIRVDSIASGKDHVVLISESLDIFTFGSNTVGQLGFKPEKTYHRSPLFVAHLNQAKKYLNMVIAHNQNFISFMFDEQIILYSWGSNKHFKLGRNTESAWLPFGKVDLSFARRKQLTKIAICSGLHHSVLNITGTLYSIGWGRYGQLGQGSCNGSNVFRKVNLYDKLPVKIFCGRWWTIILTKPNEIYFFGCDVNNEVWMAPSGIICYPMLLNDRFQDHGIELQDIKYDETTITLEFIDRDHCQRFSKCLINLDSISVKFLSKS